MKTVKYITENTVHLVEAGDRLHMKVRPDSSLADRWVSPTEFDITVRETFLNSRFGPRIFSTEHIEYTDEYGELDNDNDFYLVDDWIITVPEPEPDA